MIDNIIADKSKNIISIYTRGNDEKLNEYCGYPVGNTVEIALKDFGNSTALFTIEINTDREDGNKFISKSVKILDCPM